MTREEYNQKVIAHKHKATMIKGSLGIAAFLMLASVVGHIDTDAFNGVHTVKGIVSESGNILADNGKSYKAKGFRSGSEVTVKLDGQGNILSITTK